MTLSGIELGSGGAASNQPVMAGRVFASYVRRGRMGVRRRGRIVSDDLIQPRRSLVVASAGLRDDWLANGLAEITQEWE